MIQEFREFNEALRDELLAMAAKDHELAARLESEGKLFESYHPQLEMLHRGGSARLKQIIAKHGWPTPDLVGDDACEAASMVLQHSISDPAFMKTTLPLVEASWLAGKIPGKHYATLVDGIRFFSRRPQVYGTYSDWDTHGAMTLWPVESPKNADDTVDARRASVGLPPLATPKPGKSAEKPPSDLAKRDREMLDWLKARGWIR